MLARTSRLARLAPSLPAFRTYAAQATAQKRRTPMSTSLEYAPERKEELKANVDEVLAEIEQAAGGREPAPRLVAISKIKPASDIQALYDAGHRHFGENYIQEMSDKAAILPKDIHWHFVGPLQSNKSKLLTAIPNVFVLETLSTAKLADLLQKNLPSDRTLSVYLQVNTSGEDNKSGLPPLSSESDEAAPMVELAKHVQDKCPNLKILGFMTIGSWEASHKAGENPDFLALKTTRREYARIMGVQEDLLELSMGMSADFAEAVREGSSGVRVGTRIFGARPPKKTA